MLRVAFNSICPLTTNGTGPFAKRLRMRRAYGLHWFRNRDDGSIHRTNCKNLCLSQEETGRIQTTMEVGGEIDDGALKIMFEEESHFYAELREDLM